jgi:hypothetical protein
VHGANPAEPLHPAAGFSNGLGLDGSQVDGARADSPSGAHSSHGSLGSHSPRRERERETDGHAGVYTGTAGIPPSSSKIGEILSRVDRMGLPTPVRSPMKEAFTPYSSSRALELTSPHLVRFPVDSIGRPAAAPAGESEPVRD